MPRKASAEKLEKVVSTKISVDHFVLLEKYAKIRYIEGRIVQPTISHLLRLIVKSWSIPIMEQERKRPSEDPKVAVKKFYESVGL